MFIIMITIREFNLTEG